MKTVAIKIRAVLMLDMAASSLLIAALFVLPGPLVATDAPEITTQPASTNVLCGSAVSLSVTATGAATLQYQWFKDGLGIPGATSSSLTRNFVQWTDAASYSVVISNAFGIATSDTAVLSLFGKGGALFVWGYSANGETNVPPSVTNVISAAGGEHFMVALKADGTVLAWGTNNVGQTNVPVGLTNVVAVSAGTAFSLALKRDGTVVGWGGNGYGQINIPPGLNHVAAIAAGQRHALALKSDGTVVAWGDNSSSQLIIPAGLSNVVAIAAGDGHCLALKSNGKVIAWGNSSYGETAVPSGLSNVVAIAAAASHSLALMSDGTVTNWGTSYDYYSWPQFKVRMPLITNAVAITAGLKHDMILRNDGMVAAWGENFFGESIAPDVVSNVASIALGPTTYSSLAINQGGPVFRQTSTSQSIDFQGAVTLSVVAEGSPALAYQWRKSGVDIAGATQSVLTISPVDWSDAGIYTVVVSNIYAAVISPEATLTVAPVLITSFPTSWINYKGKTATFNVMAQGVQPLSYQWRKNGIPLENNTRISGVTTASLTLAETSAADEGNYSVSITNSVGAVMTAEVPLTTLSVLDGSPGTSIVGWGNNEYGKRSAPLWLTNAMAISAGESHSLALTATGKVVAWGANNEGQISIPSGLGNVVAIAAGYRHSVALKRDGTVVGWGRNNEGQINFPAGLTNIAAIAAGMYATWLMRSDGTVISCGNWNQTVVIGSLSNVIAIAVGLDVGYALKSDGTVAKYNSSSPLNLDPPVTDAIAITASGSYQDFSLALKRDGTVMSRGQEYDWITPYIPQPAGLTNVIAISAGGVHRLALKQDGTVVGWGPNYYNETAIPNGLADVIAIAAGQTHSLALKYNAPQITTQPANYTGTTGIIAGKNAAFQITAKGSVPLSYQWFFNGNLIPDATNNSYIRTNVQIVDVGSYSCAVSNLTGVVVSNLPTKGLLQVIPDSSRPTVAFTYPAANVRFTNDASYTNGSFVTQAPQLAFSGTATDNGLITNVTFTRLFPPSPPLVVNASLTQLAPGNQKWTNVLTLADGTNTFKAVAYDSAGLTNLLSVTRTVFLVHTSQLTVNITGQGSYLPQGASTYGIATNGGVLEIGRNYSIKAIPGNNCVLTNWTDGLGAVLTNGPTLVFRMTPDLVLNANFVTNPIIAANAAGSYNGLFYEESGLAEQSAGAINNLMLRTNGAYSGMIKIAGGSYSLAGLFDLSDNDTRTVTRTGKSSLTVTLHLDLSGSTKQITGTVSCVGEAWSSSLVADLAVFGTSNPYGSPARYTMLIPPDNDAPADSPGGDGYGLITNNALGKMILSGRLADGILISQTIPISQDGYAPFYLDLYGHRGLIEGWINFGAATRLNSGLLTWIKPATNNPSTYSSGFTNVVELQKSLYVTPTLLSSNVLAMTTGTLEIKDGDIDGLPLLWTVKLTNNALKVLSGPTNALTGSINRSTGELTVSFRPPNYLTNKTVYGAVNQSTVEALGAFSGTNQTGLIYLH